MRERISILKLSSDGVEKWRYEGEVLARDDSRLIIEAVFDRDDWLFMGVVLRRGDRFVETYFSDRWYNVYQIFDHEDGALKGYYCNICFPAKFSEGRVEYRDLFLDLWVDAGGTQQVLDEDEFNAAELDENIRHQALEALAELQQLFKLQRPLF